MTKEYRATGTTYRCGYVPNPYEPKGDGWQMCGSAADGSMLLWFWARDVQDEQSGGQKFEHVVAQKDAEINRLKNLLVDAKVRELDLEKPSEQHCRSCGAWVWILGEDTCWKCAEVDNGNKSDSSKKES